MWLFATTATCSFMLGGIWADRHLPEQWCGWVTGSGIGDAVSVGGGRVGGARGIGAKGPDATHYDTGIDAHTGSDGLVEVWW
jgi:hypothetical protein